MVVDGLLTLIQTVTKVKILIFVNSSQNISGCVRPSRNDDDDVLRNLGNVVADFASRGNPDVALQTLNVSRNR